MSVRKRERQPDEIESGRTRAGRLERELRYAMRGKSYALDGAVVSGGWVPSTVLVRLAGWRFGARLYELRCEGRVECQTRRWMHPLTGKPTEVWLYRATRLAPLDPAAVK